MKKKIIDLMTYRIEKTLKDNGFILREDRKKKIMLLIKITDGQGDGT